MRKILVAYDGSEGSEKAFEKALSLLDPDGEIIVDDWSYKIEVDKTDR